MSNYIKREDAIEQARRNWTGEGDWIATAEINLLKNLPTADVRENVRGKWWHEPHTNETWVQRCSNCFRVAMITGEEECPYNYCPICGADMRGGQHEKDN